MFKKYQVDNRIVPYIMPSLDSYNSATYKEDCHENSINETSVIRKIEDIEREAYESGFNAGQSAGFEIGEQSAILLINRLETAISDFKELRQRELKELEKQVLELSLAIAKKIIINELTTNPDIITDIVKEALTRLQRTGQIVIRLHPSLNEIFLKNRPGLLSIYPDIVFELDPKAPLYGAEVIGPEESVRTDVEEQFKNILDEMGVRLARD